MAEKTVRPVMKESVQASSSMAGRDLTIAISGMLEGLPGVTVTIKFQNVSFLISGKVFAFTRSDGVVMKLPEDRIRQLAESRDACFLVMGKRVMREWVVVRYQDAGEIKADMRLFREAMTFVSAEARRRPEARRKFGAGRK